MTYATDITLNGRGARLMRAAFALGALALVALALSACTPSPEQIAARAKDKMFEDKIEAVNLDRIRRATSLTIAHCPAILSREGIEPFLARMTAKAAEIGHGVMPPVADAKGSTIDGELLEGTPTPGIALRVAIRDLTAERSNGSGLGTADALNPVRLAQECGAEVILFDGDVAGIQRDMRDLVGQAIDSGAALAKAVDGEISIAGNRTFEITPRIVSRDRIYSFLPQRLTERGIATAPEIFHDDANPVKVGDTVRRYILYKTVIHITSTLR